MSCLIWICFFKFTLTYVLGDHIILHFFSMKIMDSFRHCHHQIGDKGYYIVKETDTILRSMSPRQHYTPDIVQKMSSDNITVIGTNKDGFVIARRGTDKEESKKSEASNGPVENGTESGATKDSQVVDNNADENDGDDEFDGDIEEEGDDNDDSNVTHTSSHGSHVVRNKNRKRSFLKSLKSSKKLRSRQPKKKLKLPEKIVNPGDKIPVEIWYTFSTCGVMWQVSE